jgi:hypothetical protein
VKANVRCFRGEVDGNPAIHRKLSSMRRSFA